MDVKKLASKLKSRDKRHCSQCGKMLKYTEFGYVEYSAGKFKFRSPCKSCQNRAQRSNSSRVSYRYKKYGITRDQYIEMYETQRGKCAICGKHYSVLSVDHSHITGGVRKLLCSKCNSILGFCGDDVIILKNAINYLS